MPVEAPSKPLDLRLVLGAAAVALGGALIAIAFLRLFQNGTCSTNGYASYGSSFNGPAFGNYYPVPHCAGGIGWWMLVGVGGSAALLVAAVVLTAARGLSIAALFGGLTAGCVLLGLHASHAHPVAGFSVTGAKVFSFAMAAFFFLFVIGFGYAALAGTTKAFAGISGVGALLAAAVAIAGAVLIGTAVNRATAPGKPKPAPAPADSSQIPADSSASLFRTANLAVVLRAAQKKVTADGFVEFLTITPSELDMTVEAVGGQGGQATPFRIGRSGAITEGTPYAYDQNHISSVFLSSFQADSGAQVAALTHTPLADIKSLTLVRKKNVLNDALEVATTTSSGAPGPTHQVLLTTLQEGGGDTSSASASSGSSSSASSSSTSSSSAPAAALPRAPKGSYAACIIAAGTNVTAENKCESLITGANAASEAQKAINYSNCVTKDPAEATTKCASLMP